MIIEKMTLFILCYFVYADVYKVQLTPSEKLFEYKAYGWLISIK